MMLKKNMKLKYDWNINQVSTIPSEQPYIFQSSEILSREVELIYLI